VHRAITALLDQGTVERDDDNYLVVDPGALLEAWADQARPPKERRRISIDHANALRDAVRRILDSLGPDAAVVSGELAAEELAPYLPAESAIIHVFDPQTFATVGGEPNRYNFATGAVRPGQIEVSLADAGYGQFATVKDDLPIASPQQVYVDLARDQSRGRQAAEHVRSALLEF
jgi:Transcriptional regulator, AbiEi antitoxin, Type IV TA system